MRRFILAGTAIAALAVPALAPALASADVQRDQTGTLVSTVNNTYVHNYTLDITGNSFTGTGSVVANGVTIPEKISGTINGSTIVSFKASYQNGSGYIWTDNGTNGTDTLGQNFTVNNQLTVFKNHGEYVSSQGGGADAAHSDIGMPTNSSK